MTKEERDECEKLADRLNAAFVWEDTPQGRAYWKQVYDSLLSLWSPPPSSQTTSSENAT